MLRQNLGLIALFITGCSGMDRSTFIDEYAEAYCEWREGCSQLKDRHSTKEQCLDDASADASSTYAPDDDECSFDETKAEECVEAFEDLGCGDVAAAEKISACQKVSDCFGQNNDTTPDTDPQ